MADNEEITSSKAKLTSVYGLGASPWEQPRKCREPKINAEEETQSENDEDLVNDLQTVTKPELGVIRPGRIGFTTKQGGISPEPAAEPPPLFARALDGVHAYSDSEESVINRGLAGPNVKPLVQQSEAVEHNDEDDIIEVDLNRMKLCRFYFMIGCLALPLLQLVNALHFRRELFGRSGNDAHPLTKMYARLSALIGVIQLLLMLSWFIVWKNTESFENLDVLKLKLNVQFV